MVSSVDYLFSLPICHLVSLLLFRLLFCAAHVCLVIATFAFSLSSQTEQALQLAACAFGFVIRYYFAGLVYGYD